MTNVPFQNTNSKDEQSRYNIHI